MKRCGIQEEILLDPWIEAAGLPELAGWVVLQKRLVRYLLAMHIPPLFEFLKLPDRLECFVKPAALLTHVFWCRCRDSGLIIED